ncbi:uncharacterized protein LOC132261698 [Phlebotomus argentipes]|uniref:uncharacterized protein LOC132261698 n=1 Tax=Phlebotomus argentipes TaxID=94469 RepID=UPI00289306EA|nr:uncharacterized protein LOC132261698 [Phlebotomus argentipes]XP_059616620.1 uncharacterized protein LOC132261698 [Phlebotomus argentipes]
MNPSVNAHGGGAARHIRYTIPELIIIGESVESHRRPACFNATPIGSTARLVWRQREESSRAEVEKTKKTNGADRADRRIGSGRFVDHEAFWDNKMADDVEIELFGQRSSAPWQPLVRRERADRWGVGNRNSTGFFDVKNRRDSFRRNPRDYDTEPEWLSGGPTSKFDMVELHGFDDAPNQTVKHDDQPTVSSSTPVKLKTGSPTPEEGSGSRFSQWLPKPHDSFDSHRFSLYNDLENIMNDSSTDACEGASNKNCAPPLITVNGNDVPSSVKEFLQKANVGTSARGGIAKQRIVSVKDLEVSLRDCAFNEKPVNAKDMDVFKNFVANMPNDQLGAKAAEPFFFHAKSSLGPYVELLQRVILHGETQLNRQELLNTSEGQEHLQALLRGELSVYNLLNHLQFVSPGREQEILIAVIFAFSQTSQLATLPRASFQMPFFQNGPPFNPMGGQMFHPPPQNPIGLLANGKPQRMPSPRELHLHTQSIMHNALMRKRFEDQLSGHVRKQNAGAGNRGQSSSNASLMFNMRGGREAEVKPPKKSGAPII